MLIDLTHPLEHGQATFASDPKLSIIPHGTTKTLKYNISQISMGTHQGTHLDAMFHFLENGKTIDQMPLDWFYGFAHVIRIPKGRNEEITVQDLIPFESLFSLEAKIIIETGWHQAFGKDYFFTDFPSITQEAARFIAHKKIRLLGMDMPTPGKDWYELHHILLPEEIVIVESLANLDKLPERFIFMGFPLNLKGRDGSPIRAVGLMDSLEA